MSGESVAGEKLGKFGHHPDRARYAGPMGEQDAPAEVPPPPPPPRTPPPVDEPIPGPDGLTRSVRLAAEYLAKVVEADCGAKQGRTALYWSLIHTLSDHAGRKDAAPETPPAEPPARAERDGYDAGELRRVLDELKAATSPGITFGAVLNVTTRARDRLAGVLNPPGGEPERTDPRTTVRATFTVRGPRRHRDAEMVGTFKVAGTAETGKELAERMARTVMGMACTAPAFRAADLQGDWPEETG